MKRLFFRSVIVLTVLALSVFSGAFVARAASTQMVAFHQVATPSLPDILAQVAASVVLAAFLATVAERLVAGLITPIFDKFKWDKFYLMYISWVVGGGLVFLAQINLFSLIIQDQMIGMVLSAILSGGGANLLHDLFDKPPVAAG